MLFPHLDGLSAENMILDFYVLQFQFRMSILGPWLQDVIALNSFTLALKTSF